MRRFGFTMIELIFVIVIMGIIGKFGVEFLAQSYKSFIFSSVNHSLQAKGEVAVESIASRLQYRIKDSIIGRESNNTNFSTNFRALNSALGTSYDILEWVGSDIDGFRGNALPYWSGIIDLDASKALGSATLVSPGTNTTTVDSLIKILADNPTTSTTTINDAALYFIGSDTDINNYGWDGNALATQTSSVMHPIMTSGNTNEFVPRSGGTAGANTFAGVDVYEYYKLAWTAYAVGISDYNASTSTGTLRLYYDYQPWDGEKYTDNTTKNVVLMENVSTFQFKAVGSVVKIQVCVNDDLVEDYSLCKEKTVF